MKIQVLFLVLFVAMAFGHDDSDSNESDEDDDDRVIGGIDATNGQMPFMASLRYVITGRHRCGGSIISKNWIVTAAHCIERQHLMYVTAGSIYLNAPNIRYLVKSVVIHPKYNSRRLTADIALVQTIRNMPIGSPNVKAINLNRSPVPDNSSLVGCGWGWTSNPGSLSNRLKIFNTTSFNNTECQEAHANSTLAVTKANLCTLAEGIKGFCYGDGGSPVIHNDTLAGIASWGKGCALGVPDVNVAIDKYASWIDRTMRTRK